MNEFVYNQMCAYYGLKEMTDDRFIGLFASIVKHSTNKRVSNFGRLLGIFDNWNVEDQIL